jgi:hypothetical protein
MWNEIFGTGDTKPIDWQDEKSRQAARDDGRRPVTAISSAGSAAQQASIYNYNLYGAKINKWSPSEWVFDGRPCTIEEFALAVYGEDDPRTSEFILRYTR